MPSATFPPERYFGDTHLHTDISMDAGAFGNRLGLDDAYRFARGEQVNSTRGGPVRLSRPLDFLVVADHSDNMGFFPDLLDGRAASSCRTRPARTGTTASRPARAWMSRWRLSACFHRTSFLRR